MRELPLTLNLRCFVRADIAIPIILLTVTVTIHAGTLNAAAAARVEACDHSQRLERVVVQAVQADPTELFVLLPDSSVFRPAPVAHGAHKVWHLFHLLSIVTGEGAPLTRAMALLGLEDVARECHVA